MADLARIFKAYDVRGLVPEELDEDVAYAVGSAFARLDTRRAAQPQSGRSPRRQPRPDAPPIVVGHDMRESSPGLAAGVAAGALDAGRDVLEVGLASTDELYFASGSLDAPAVMVTASHNPAAYNGFKLCLAGAVALSAATGLDEIRADAASASSAARGRVATLRGSARQADLLPSYVDHLLGLSPVAGRRLKVVVDAANAMAGLTAPAVFARLDVDLVPLFFELDGTFPHHEANPLEPANLRDLSAAVVQEGADLGFAFDGDADRCFVVDERGRPVSPSVVTSLIATRELARHPGATVLHNLITSRSVPETVTAHGGTAVRTPVGHSLIKAEMARTGAVFGGEHSGHYYFRDFWYADSGMLAALHVLAVVASDDRPVSELAAALSPYTASGEINLTVAHAAAATARVEQRYADVAGVELDRLDGLSVIGEDWWLNVRSSNTEPLLRLNVEAPDEAAMAHLRDSTLALLRSDPLRSDT